MRFISNLLAVSVHLKLTSGRKVHWCRRRSVRLFHQNPPQ